MGRGRAHGPNVSCLVEYALFTMFSTISVLKFVIVAGRSDPESAATGVNKFVPYLSPETVSNLAQYFLRLWPGLGSSNLCENFHT